MFSSSIVSRQDLPTWQIAERFSTIFIQISLTKPISTAHRFKSVTTFRLLPFHLLFFLIASSQQCSALEMLDVLENWREADKNREGAKSATMCAWRGLSMLQKVMKKSGNNRISTEWIRVHNQSRLGDQAWTWGIFRAKFYLFFRRFNWSNYNVKSFWNVSF